jgi:hypothetical protein
MSVVSPDLKPPPRVKDKVLLSILHRDWRECVLCESRGPRLSLHHIHKHPRDDVRPNLVMLCGDGVRGCHGAIEGGVRETKEELGRYIYFNRPDTLDYLATKLVRPGDPPDLQRAHAWLDSSLGFPY